MKILFLTKYYSEYITNFENKTKTNNLNFFDHQKLLFDDHFSWTSDFSEHLKSEGLTTFFSIANYKQIQIKWAKENNLKLQNDNHWEKKIVYEQIKIFKPDIIWIFAIFDYYGKFLEDLRPYCKKIISWISSPYPKNLSFNGIDYMVTSDEGLFLNNKSNFKKVVTTLPSFNPNILNKIDSVNYENKNLPSIGFSGQFTIDHKIRSKYMKNLLLDKYNINITGLVTPRPLIDIIRKFIFFFISYNFKSMFDFFCKFKEFNNFYHDAKFLNKLNIKPLFGMEYYNFIKKNDIIINIHSDDSNEYGGAQRIVEVTGIGSCLITEFKKDTKKQFNFDNELIGYVNFDDLKSKINKINNNEIDYKSIAIKGQTKTLDEYSSNNMLKKVTDIFYE